MTVPASDKSKSFLRPCLSDKAPRIGVEKNIMTAYEPRNRPSSIERISNGKSAGKRPCAGSMNKGANIGRTSPKPTRSRKTTANKVQSEAFFLSIRRKPHELHSSRLKTHERRVLKFEF